jgi:hypothetical protein
MCTLVSPENVDQWIRDASHDEVHPFVPLDILVDGMEGDSPLYGWHNIKLNHSTEHWIVSFSRLRDVN